MEKIEPPILMQFADGRPRGYVYAMDDRFVYIKHIDGTETKMSVDDRAQLVKRPLSERN